MPIFAPSYRPREARKPFAIRQQQRLRKRKRDDEDSNDEAGPSDSPEPEATSRITTTTFHPVNRTDPYHIAGHAREEPLPPHPFPHAAVRETKPKPRPVEEELAELNPPLFISSAAPSDDNSTSLRRRHLDNLTTILHRCMLKGDWPRAHRAWTLLIRTQIAGRGIDVRRNGRWTMGAELLMRKDAKKTLRQTNSHPGELQDDTSSAIAQDERNATADDHFSDEGFKLARDYYERLIVQYPYTRSTMHTLNATTIYPALFNVWIYGVQMRFRRARKALESEPDDTESISSSIPDLDEEPQKSHMHRINLDELEQALPIADRMDELLISPPYDSSTELKRLRRMIAAWLARLFDRVESFGGERIDLDRAARERAKADL